MSDDRMNNANQATTDGPSPDAVSEADDLTQAQRQRDEYLDQLQRTRAEFANFQKRSKAQAESDRAYAAVPLALDLIAVLDNFERAAEAARTTGASSIVEGLDMVHKQLLGALAKHGIEPIQALGQPFDPNQHEALTQTPDAEHPEGTVVGELGKGYRLLDRVLRPTKVAVSVRPGQ
jgi:molecular chaperone GrpE